MSHTSEEVCRYGFQMDERHGLFSAHRLDDEGQHTIINAFVNDPSNLVIEVRIGDDECQIRTSNEFVEKCSLTLAGDNIPCLWLTSQRRMNNLGFSILSFHADADAPFEIGFSTDQAERVEG